MQYLGVRLSTRFMLLIASVLLFLLLLNTAINRLAYADNSVTKTCVNHGADIVCTYTKE